MIYDTLLVNITLVCILRNIYYVLNNLGVGSGGGWGISLIFTSGQHSQLINCTHKYFCYSCNLYYIRDCFFKRFFLLHLTIELLQCALTPYLCKKINFTII